MVYYITREFKDVVFEDVVFDNNRFYLILYLDFTWYGVAELLLSNTTSSNTTSLNSQITLHRIRAYIDT